MCVKKKGVLWHTFGHEANCRAPRTDTQGSERTFCFSCFSTIIVTIASKTALNSAKPWLTAKLLAVDGSVSAAPVPPWIFDTATSEPSLTPSMVTFGPEWKFGTSVFEKCRVSRLPAAFMGDEATIGPRKPIRKPGTRRGDQSSACSPKANGYSSSLQVS